MRSIHLKTCTIALAAALSVPVFAQGTSGAGGSGGTTAGGGTTSSSTMSGGAGSSGSDTTTRSDRSFDWGWLGLLGLAGLMGMRKQPHDVRMDTTRTTAQR